MQRKARMTNRIFVVLAIASAALPARAEQASFLRLEWPPGGAVWADLSGDGTTLVGDMAAPNGTTVGFRWRAATGYEVIAYPGAIGTVCRAVSYDGEVVCGSTDTQIGREAFRWTPAGGIEILGDLPTGPVRAFATRMSADGNAISGVGTTSLSHNIEGFYWTRELGMIPIGDFPGNVRYSAPLGISADGSTLTGAGRSTYGDEAFLWTPGGGLRSFDPPGHIVGLGIAISADGSTVLGLAYYGFLWDAVRGPRDFPPVNGHLFIPENMTADARYVVGHHDPISGDADVAYIWDQRNGYRKFSTLMTSRGVDLSGWSITNLRHISDNGRVILGIGWDALDHTYYFLANLGDPPCPADVDGDFDVDLPDLATLLINFGRADLPDDPDCAAGPTRCAGDLDADHDVDLDDLATLLIHFGAVCD
jgi:hypothetical protein